MAVVVIDTIKPKNQGTFPVVEAKDVKVDNNDKRLDTALGEKASQADVTALSETVSGKANQSDLTALSNTVSGKASQADLTALSNTVADKADKSALAETNAAVAGKQAALTESQLAACNSGITSVLVTQIGTNTTDIATKADAEDVTTLQGQMALKADSSDLTTATNNLQSQIDLIVTPVTQDAEVENARVDAVGTTFTSLKARCDSDDVKHSSKESELEIAVNSFPFTDHYNPQAITWTRTDKYVNNTGAETSANYYYQSEFAVQPGEKYLVTGTYDYGKCVFVTENVNGDVIQKVFNTAAHTVVENIVVSIGVTETKLILQSSAEDRSHYVLQKFDTKTLGNGSVDRNALVNEVKNCIASYDTTINLLDINAAGVTIGHYINQSNQLTESDVMNVSDYIPIEQNVEYKFPVYANYFGSENAARIPYYNAEKTYWSFVTGTYDSDTKLLSVTFTNANAYYTRINFGIINSYVTKTDPKLNPENMMFTKAPYPSTYIPYGNQGFMPDNIFFSMTDQQKLNPLFRKKIVFTGDSICNGSSARDNLNGWAGRIGRNNQMTWTNAGISGATFTTGLTGSAGVIADTNFFDADYLIIEGGTNDADLIGDALTEEPQDFGTYSMGDYTSNFDNTTYCGAIESLFKRLTTDYKGKKIGCIIAQKMGGVNATYPDYTKEHNNRRFYFETLMTLCEKWGIPYLNLWDNCMLNPMIPAHYTENEDYMYVDGQHLTSNGYDYISPIIESWLKTL